MKVRELLIRLTELPPETELLAEIGGANPNAVAVIGLEPCPDKNNCISLELDAVDVNDAFLDFRPVPDASTSRLDVAG
jgi:hypothetical protein